MALAGPHRSARAGGYVGLRNVCSGHGCAERHGAPARVLLFNDQKSGLYCNLCALFLTVLGVF